jgi:soluble lytic murein transglycosylase-like protein
MHDVGLPTWITPIPAALTAYLDKHNAPDGTAALLLDGIAVARGMGYKTPDPLLFACLARYESHFKDSSIGSAGERGMLQIHPCHKRSMKRLGLNFYSGKERIAYGCILWQAQGLKPWAVRTRAMKDYRGVK